MIRLMEVVFRRRYYCPEYIGQMEPTIGESLYDIPDLIIMKIGWRNYNRYGGRPLLKVITSNEGVLHTQVFADALLRDVGNMVLPMQFSAKEDILGNIYFLPTDLNNPTLEDQIYSILMQEDPSGFFSYCGNDIFGGSARTYRELAQRAVVYLEYWNDISQVKDNLEKSLALFALTVNEEKLWSAARRIQPLLNT